MVTPLPKKQGNIQNQNKSRDFVAVFRQQKPDECNFFRAYCEKIFIMWKGQLLQVLMKTKHE